MVQHSAVSEVVASQIKEASLTLESVKKEIHKVIINQDVLINRLLIALLCDGHILIEGVPGIAKTLIVNTLAKSLRLDCKRIQFTPDLLPSDLTGISIYNPKEGTFAIQKGPVFTNIVLADEINRAPPKVQSALLEVMGERQVTISGQTLHTEDPFLVLATQNPIEHEGTYPLPEALTDRFMMKVLMTYPTKEQEKEIIRLHSERSKTTSPVAVLDARQINDLRKLVDQIYIDEKVLDYIVDLVFTTRASQEKGGPISKLVQYGASPRASIFLAKTARAHAFLEGRSYVTPHDIKEIGPDVLRHRLVLSYEAEAEVVSPDEIIERVFNSTTVP